MILTAHQPVYLPWLGLFHKIALADEFIFFDDVQYTTKDYVSRNLIKGANAPVLLTVPVLSKNHYEKKISQIEINNSQNWSKKHWKTIYLNYKNSKYFSKYADFWQDLYSKDWKLLSDLNYEILLWHLNVLKIKTKVTKMSDYDFKGEKSDLVLDMCKKTGCSCYIFGKLGKDYAEVDKFQKVGIKLYFQNYNHPTYTQQYPKQGFKPYMAAIDLIFNEGGNSFDIIMSENATRAEIS